MGQYKNFVTFQPLFFLFWSPSNKVDIKLIGSVVEPKRHSQKMAHTPPPSNVDGETPMKKLSSLFTRLTTESPFGTPYRPQCAFQLYDQDRSGSTGRDRSGSSQDPDRMSGSTGRGNLSCDIFAQEKPSSTPAGPKTKVLPRRPSKRASLIRLARHVFFFDFAHHFHFYKQVIIL